MRFGMGFGIDARYGGPTRLSVPVGFTYTPPFQIFDNGTTNFDFDSLYSAISPSDITDYYVSPSGTTGNDGLTPSTPKRAINAILTTAAGASTPWVRINLEAGDYPHSSQISAQSSYGKNVIIRASGNVRTGSFVLGTSLTWTLSSGTTYSATRSSVLSVRDTSVLNSYGDATKYTNAADLASCQSTPRSWFQSGSTIYVNNGVGQPGAAVMVLLNAPNAKIDGGDTVWIFDGGVSGKIEFIGGASYCLSATPSGNNQKVYARNCWFRYSQGNNLQISGTPLTILVGGGASGSDADCLNYHWDSLTAQLPTAIEIGVTAYDAGVSGATQNCSTMHDGGTIIRVGGRYNGSLGPVVADVNDGTQSWNIRCDARNSLLNSATATDASWCVFTGTSKMWLDHCTYGAGVSTSEYGLSVDTACTMYLRGTPTGNDYVAGTLTTY